MIQTSFIVQAADQLDDTHWLQVGPELPSATSLPLPHVLAAQTCVCIQQQWAEALNDGMSWRGHVCFMLEWCEHSVFLCYRLDLLYRHECMRFPKCDWNVLELHMRQCTNKYVCSHSTIHVRVKMGSRKRISTVKLRIAGVIKIFQRCCRQDFSKGADGKYAAIPGRHLFGVWVGWLWCPPPWQTWPPRYCWGGAGVGMVMPWGLVSWRAACHCSVEPLHHLAKLLPVIRSGHQEAEMALR